MADSFTSFIFKNYASIPPNPIGGSYDGTDEVVPATWTKDGAIVAFGLFAWLSVRVYSVVNGVWESSEWSNPIQLTGNVGLDGVQGLRGIQGFTGFGIQGNVGGIGNTGLKGAMGTSAINGTSPIKGTDYFDGAYNSFIFKNSITKPANPTGGSYNGFVEITPIDWEDDPSIPNANETTWVSKARYIQTNSGWINQGWSSSSRFSGEAGITPTLGIDYFNGKDGTYTSYIFANSDIPLPSPTGGSYDGAVETFPIGWTDDPESPLVGDFIWVTKRKYSNINGVWQSTSWSVPSKFSGEKGYTPVFGIDYKDGANGTFTSFIFRNSELPPLIPTGGSYDGVNEIAPVDWEDDPINPPENYSTWISTTKYSVVNDVWVNNNWSIPAKFSGDSIKLLLISSSARAFSYDNLEVLIAPNEIDFLAHASNLTDPVNWTTLPDVGSGTGESFTLTAAAFDTSMEVKVTATSGVLTDVITIIRLQGSYTPVKGLDYVDGLSGAYNSTIYISSENIPTTPTGGTWNGATETLPSGGWVDDALSPSTGHYIWVSNKIYTTVIDSGGENEWINTATWSTPIKYSYIPTIGVDYASGVGNFVSYIFKNEDQGVIPSTPSGGSYNGSTEVTPTGWTDNPTTPLGDQVTWVTTFTYTTDMAGMWGTGAVWGTPAKFTQEASLVGYLDNENHTVPADSSGNVLSFSGAGGKFITHFGAVLVTSECTFTSQTLSGTLTFNLTGNTYNITSLTSDNATVRIFANHTASGQSINSVYTITKQKQGNKGNPGDAGGSGSAGDNGQRGNLTVEQEVSGTNWANASFGGDTNGDTIATALMPSGEPQASDTVTLYNPSSGNEFSTTKAYNGSAWVEITRVVDATTLYNATQFFNSLVADSIDTSFLDVTTLKVEEADWGDSIAIYETGVNVGAVLLSTNIYIDVSAQYGLIIDSTGHDGGIYMLGHDPIVMRPSADTNAGIYISMDLITNGDAINIDGASSGNNGNAINIYSHYGATQGAAGINVSTSSSNHYAFSTNGRINVDDRIECNDDIIVQGIVTASNFVIQI